MIRNGSDAGSIISFLPYKPLGAQLEGPNPRSHQQKSQGKTLQFLIAPEFSQPYKERKVVFQSSFFRVYCHFFLVWLKMMVSFVINLVDV